MSGKSRRYRAMIASLALAGAASSHAAEMPAPPPVQAFVMPETEVWDINSAEGAPYRIFVSRPPGPAPADGYPILYVLDGNAMFAGFAEERRIQQFNDNKGPIGNMLIVAIGYPADRAYDIARRTKDYTPPMRERPARSQPRMDRARSGEHEKFVAFILDRLQPEIARRYTINPGRQSLFGHSLGGLFALHMFYTRQDVFHTIISASPSIWWNDQVALEEERAFAARLASSKTNLPTSRLLLLVGSEESSATVGDAKALSGRLQALSAYGVRSDFEEFVGETHISVPGRAVTRTLRWASEFP